MRLSTRNGLGAAGLALALGACQGNLGTGAGGGISLPQTPAYGQPPPGGVTPQSRQRVLEGAVTLAPDLDAIPLPSLEGYSVTLALGTPTPQPSPSVASTAASPPARRSRGSGRVREISGSSRSPSAAPTAAPTAGAGVDVARPSPAASASGSPSAQNSDVARAQKIATKTIVFPDDAPPPPSPQPTGNVQTFGKRTAIVRGFASPGADVALYGLGAVRFTIPASEQTAARGFTVAVFETGKKHHERLVGFDTQATLSENGVASAHASDPITLKKNSGYLFMLYGDELPATPAPAVSGYPPPGNNPFVTPIPSGYPGGPGGPPAGPASAPPLGPATPFNPNAPPHP